MLSIIGVISDTHGLLRPEAIQALSNSDLIIHAGDIGGPDILERLEKIAPVHAVKGNMDSGAWTQSLPSQDVIEVHGRCIYFLHEIEYLDLDPCAANFEMVISGHTHTPKMYKKDSVLYLNPGSAGPRRFTLPVAVAKVTVNADGLNPEIIKLNV